MANCTANDEKPAKERKLYKDDISVPTVLCETRSLTDGGQLLHIISDWVEPGTTTKCLTVAILLPPGTLSGNLSVRNAEDGCGLNITMSRAELLINLKVLHPKCLQPHRSDRREGYHPNPIGFNQFLKSHRARGFDRVNMTP